MSSYFEAILVYDTVLGPWLVVSHVVKILVIFPITLLSVTSIPL